MIDTEHYKLHKPDENDYYNQSYENENMDAIDAALHGLETGKETPKGAQEKANQAKEDAISACRPVGWMPTAEEVGAPTLGEDGLIQISQIPTLPPIVKTSGTGSAFTATIDGVTELTIGMLITIIPHTTSKTTTPTLNINGLGAKEIRRRYSHTSSSVTDGYMTTWLSTGDPQLLQYDGTYWIAVGANKPYVSDLSNPVSVSKGGTGRTSWSTYQLIYPSTSNTMSQLAFPTTSGSFLRQGTSGAPYWTTPEDVRETIDAVPNDRTINGKPLSENVELTPMDIGSSRPNLLDNWYFGNPINQRGQEHYDIKNLVYTIDRWKSSGNLDTRHYGTLDISDDYVLIKSDNASMGIHQVLENVSDLNGKTVTLSFLAEIISGKYVVSIKDKQTKQSDRMEPNGKQLYTLTTTVDIDSDSILKCLFDGIDASSAKIYAAKLELGSTSTLAYRNDSGDWLLNDPPPNVALELAKCQRYSLSVGENILRSSMKGPNTLCFTMPTPTTMRNSPTVVGDLSITNYSDTSNITGFIFAAWNKNNTLQIIATKNNHGVSDAYLKIPNNTIFDANI